MKTNLRIVATACGLLLAGSNGAFAAPEEPQAPKGRNITHSNTVNSATSGSGQMDGHAMGTENSGVTNTPPADARGMHTRPVVGADDRDNSAMNVRDRADNAVTADQQSNDSSDIDVIARIRQAIIRADGMSQYANNVKIVIPQEGGNVVLRGSVRSEAERTRVVQLAQEVARPRAVTSELEIAR